jgi:hypothetical protein
VHKLFVGLIRRTACAHAQFSGCSSTSNDQSETGPMAVCCQNLPLGAPSSRSAPSVLFGELFKKFSLFLNTGVFSFPRLDWTFMPGGNGNFVFSFILFIMKEEKCSIVLTVWGWNWSFKEENAFLLGRLAYLPDRSIVTYATVSRGPCYRPNRKQQGSSKARAIVHPNGFDFQVLPLGCASLLLAGATGGTFMKHKFIFPPQFVDVIITIVILEQNMNHNLCAGCEIWHHVIYLLCCLIQ